MPYNFAADSFHTNKNGRFAFLSPPLGDLGATYGDHLRLVGNRVVDFLLVIIELLSLAVTAEALQAKIGDFAPTRSH